MSILEDTVLSLYRLNIKCRYLEMSERIGRLREGGDVGGGGERGKRRKERFGGEGGGRGGGEWGEGDGEGDHDGEARRRRGWRIWNGGEGDGRY